MKPFWLDSLYSIEEADFIIASLPYELGSVVKKGCGKAPRRIAELFGQTNTFDLERKKDLADRKIKNIGTLKTENLKKQVEKLTKSNPKAKVLFIGGDHTITQLIAPNLPVKSVLSLDAHFDLYDKWEKGQKIFQGSTMRRLYEKGIKLYLRGVRASPKSTYEFAEENKIDWQTDFKKIPKKVDYLSIDVDVMDPVYVDSAFQEPFGVSPEQVIDVIRKTDFKYCDLVEWIPDKGYPYIIQIVKEILFK